MAERARLGERRGRVSEVGRVAPGGVGMLSSGAECRVVCRASQPVPVIVDLVPSPRDPIF